MFKKMKLTKRKLIFAFITVATISIVILVGNSQPVGRVSLGVLFSTLIWYRSDQHVSRWLALLVLWLGILIPVLYMLIKN